MVCDKVGQSFEEALVTGDVDCELDVVVDESVCSVDVVLTVGIQRIYTVDGLHQSLVH